MSKPLDGVLVVSLEQAVAAPTCSCRLADAGARVIKVERAEGDFARGYDRVVNGGSSYFVWLNRGKESIVLDLRAEPDRALLDRMLARADIFIQNFKPGALARAGFGSEELRQKHPCLITCDISGYGETGPYRDRKAYDLLIQAESGLAAVTGPPEAPGRVGVSVVDIGTGMNAYAAILEALIERGRTGKGKGIAVSLFDAMADWMAVPLLHFDYGGKAPPRVGLAHPSIAPYGVYDTEDGPILISIQNEREWRILCREALQRPDLAEDPRFLSNVARVANRAVLDAEIGAIFGGAGRDEMVARLIAADIAFAAVNEVADLSRHPHLRRVEVGSDTGPVKLPAPPARFAEGPRALGPVPALDEHGPAIRREFAA